MDCEVITTFVEAIQHASLGTVQLIQSVSTLINNQLPHEYLATLNDEDKLEALWACLIVSLLTKGHVILCKFQLEASLGMLHQHDCVIIAGTGSGKTLCLLMPIFLRPESISMTISPLKCLQTNQVR